MVIYVTDRTLSKRSGRLQQPMNLRRLGPASLALQLLQTLQPKLRFTVSYLWRVAITLANKREHLPGTVDT